MRRAYVAALCFVVGCAEPEPPAPQPPAPPPEDASSAPEVREPVPDTIALRHILIPVESERGEGLRLDDAMALALSLRERALGGESFESLAIEYSHDASARRGGWLGAGQRESWVPEFSDAAWTLQEGEISQPVVSDFGVHLIKREPLIEVYLKQVVVQHRDSLMVLEGSPAANRDPEEARRLAEEALGLLRDGAVFEDVARSHSDGPMGPRGGDLGLFLRGELGPSVDAAIADLEPGELSGVVETPFGFHVLLRYAP